MISTVDLESNLTTINYSYKGECRRVESWESKQFEDTYFCPNDKPSYVKIGNKLIEWVSYSNRFASATSKHIDNMLSLMRFPEKWRIENVAEPTAACKILTAQTAKQLYFEANLIPIRIAPSIEEGIMLTYHEPESNKTLIIEVYNDLDVAGIVNQYKTILISRDIVNGDFKELIGIFNGNTGTP